MSIVNVIKSSRNMAMPADDNWYAFHMVDIITRVPGIERVELIEVDKATLRGPPLHKTSSS
jgi:hypothetical protein